MLFSRLIFISVGSSSSYRTFHHSTEAEPFDLRLVVGCRKTKSDLLETTLKKKCSFFLVLLSLANTVGWNVIINVPTGMSEFGFGFFSVEALRLLLTVNSGVQRRCWCGSCGVSKRVGCVLSVLWLPKRVRQPQLDVSCDVHAYSKHFAFKQPQTFKQPLTRYFYISCFESVNLSALTSCHSAPSTSAYLAELAIKQQLIFWRKSHLCLMPLPGLNPHVSLLYSLNMVGQIRSGDFLAHFEKQNWFYLTKYGCFISFEAACFCNRAPHEQLMPSVSQVN